uniref:Uncharacterized protein n=1 Tax=Candidatus Kentrum sp. LPFa TaxID=2126335 RepID=A0A450X0M2_9GAMM|nr:MAG: hypothetical protein BECKLPF1236B_GA0070989_13303 [Candidatus Kentron sp. LPFa]
MLALRAKTERGRVFTHAAISPGSLFFRYLDMEYIHCASQLPFDEAGKHGVYAQNGFLYESLLLKGSFPQHIIYHIITMSGTPNADTQPIEVGSIDMRHDTA